MNIHNVQFIKSAVHIGQKPKPDMPEVAVIGRSNVGKSSLINTLFNRKRLAKTSATPGKTKFFNYFLIDKCLYFVDLPGYGYTKLSKKEKEDWQKNIEAYLKNNVNLKRVFLLLDARHHLLSNDIAMINWLEFYQIPYNLILTKSDKVSRGQLNETAKKLKIAYPAKEIFSFSALKKTGREELIAELEQIIIRHPSS
jgi:GTP-binding protein